MEGREWREDSALRIASVVRQQLERGRVEDIGVYDDG